MTAIVIQPNSRFSRVTAEPEDFMPLATRMLVAREVNAHWAEFVREMHDGDLVGPDVAAKFWKFVTR